MLIKSPTSLSDIKPRTDRYAPKPDSASALPEAEDETTTTDIPDSVFEVKPRTMKAATNKQAKESPVALGAKPTAEDAAMLKNMSVSERFKLLNSRAKAATQAKPSPTKQAAETAETIQKEQAKQVGDKTQPEAEKPTAGGQPTVPEKAPLGVATFSFGAISPLKQTVGPGLSGPVDKSLTQKEQAHD